MLPMRAQILQTLSLKVCKSDSHSICGILYGLETMIYSIIYSVIANLTVDQAHEQNVCSQAFIFTKENPDKIIEFIKKKDKMTPILTPIINFEKLL